MIGFTLLPHVLAKVNRVHYGLLRPHELEIMSKAGTLPRSRRFLAVPFVGKDAPSPSSEYAHPDVAIGLSTMAYRYEGLRPADFHAVLSHLRTELDAEHGPELQRPSGALWITWVHSAPGGRRVRGTAGAKHQTGAAARAARLANSSTFGMESLLAGDAAAAQSDIMPLHLIDLADSEYIDLLYSILRLSGDVVKYYLETIVFPETTSHQASKLSANGQDLGGEMLFGTRIGFSGTPSGLLPLEMGECVYAPGDDAKMMRSLTDPNVVSKHVLSADWSPEGLITSVAKHEPTPHALIDAGALVTGLSNEQVASRLLSSLPADMFDGVVFLVQGGHKRIVLRSGGGAM